MQVPILLELQSEFKATLGDLSRPYPKIKIKGLMEGGRSGYSSLVEQLPPHAQGPTHTHTHAQRHTQRERQTETKTHSEKQ